MNFKEEKLNISKITYKSQGLNLEGLIFKPEGQGNFPGVIFLHGHGGSSWDSALIGYFLASSGFAAFLPSQVGYGFSEGEKDFNGPKTVKGVIDGIEIFLNQAFVNGEKIGIWGVSRGATVAALIATQKPDFLKAAVFQSGAYETKLNYETTKVEGIKETIREEIGTDENEFRVRSPIYSMDKISCPALILHGEEDERVLAEQARLLDKKLTELGKPHETIILKGSGHFITRETRSLYTFPFLAKFLK